MLVLGRYLMFGYLDPSDCDCPNPAEGVQNESSFTDLWAKAFKLGARYTSGLFGKYMNNPACSCPVESGCRRLPKGDQAAPPGWDRWFALCNMGKYFKNTYNDDGQVSQGCPQYTYALVSVSFRLLGGMI